MNVRVLHESHSFYCYFKYEVDNPTSVGPTGRLLFGLPHVSRGCAVMAWQCNNALRTAILLL